MRCPFCNSFEDQVIDSRPMDQASVIRRRRECLECHKRYTTYERLEEMSLMVVKSDQRREPFNRQKVREGIIRACEKRPISSDAVEKIVNEVEYELQDYVMEVPSRIIGEKVLKKLWDLDLIAYIRFASVYQQFDDIDRFMDELKKLKKVAMKNGKNSLQEVMAGRKEVKSEKNT
ncbi:MAG TPA: transcriptional regulator NrdR [Elusimicrobia bacterium]|nr:MAG: transcriptional regulator NrdR [Elusimicrobia bacterium RIFOXYA12_FULL_49_49]OGS10758.1 MAG: transcriptional regulator NrdR [Elusimicrobia bacterium RIFOXYB1_FULL_48_9]OGS15505.1 MAG: transcriptional regulator NrdR [Elusimicrobia bacterium RIFOXYA2_FULL_47_53]OGS27000.1 MAG: transcriptional regulator NrdR [Elusimicrobia bacterium RIFOXYB12_FULL_50_12]OGS30945.1 MAG: transcriptional regulator NrdR [Elusimicrobia bacterium RIFOXYB2_FULL_46_23]HBU69086.1 transcriptional regulator NrdR [El